MGMNSPALWGKKGAKRDEVEEKGHCILTQLRESQASTKSQTPACVLQVSRSCLFSDTREIWPCNRFIFFFSLPAQQKAMGAAPFLHLALLSPCSDILHTGQQSEGRFG